MRFNGSGKPCRNDGVYVHSTTNVHEGLASPRQMKGRCRADKAHAASADAVKDRVRGGRSLRLPTEPCVRVRTRLIT
jgi:hypothetical protein